MLAIAAAQGYSTLERIQLLIVTAMILGAGVTLVLYHPDWLALLKGAIVPQPLVYPPWLKTAYPDLAAQPVWVETTRYVGVIGGSGFDYMAYTSFVRQRAWGQAGQGPVSAAQLAEIARDPTHPVRRWVRAPLIDCSLSFLVIVIFTAVFVASGTIILGPHHKIPDENNLLGLQSAFVTSIHPWLFPLYVAGAFLAMFGTLYGTLEVGCAIVAEMAHCVSREFALRTGAVHPASDDPLVRDRRRCDPAVVVRIPWDRRFRKASPLAGHPDSGKSVYGRVGLRTVLSAELMDGPPIPSPNAAAAHLALGVERRRRSDFREPGTQRLLGRPESLVRGSCAVWLAATGSCRRIPGQPVAYRVALRRMCVVTVLAGQSVFRRWGERRTSNVYAFADFERGQPARNR